MTSKNLYEILGIPLTATADEIKFAYRRQAMKWHPDRNQGNQAEAEVRFKEIAYAYSILSDPFKRQEYDRVSSVRDDYASGDNFTDEMAFDIFLAAILDMAFDMAQHGHSESDIYRLLLEAGCLEGLAKTVARRAYLTINRASKVSGGDGRSTSENASQKSQSDRAQAPPHSYNSASASNSSDITAQYKAVIGDKNTDYYLAKFEQFDQQGPGLKASWNWPALFFTFAWTLYRKMYGWSLIYFVVYLVWSISGAGAFLDLAFFAFAVVFAVFANSLYHRHVTNKISNSKFVTGSYQAQLKRLHGVGGIHAWVVWVAVGIPLLGILAAIVIPTLQPQETASTPNEVPTSNPSDLASAQPSASAESSQAPSDVNDPYTKMQTLYNDRRYVDLAVFVQNHLIQNPKDYLALNYGGLALHAMGDINGARLRYKNAIALMPKDPALYYNLASTYNPNTEYQAMTRILKTAQKNDPDNQLINEALMATQSIAQKMEAERQAEARYMKQSRSNVSNDDELDCEVKPVMTDEEIQNWRTCQPKVR